MTALLNELQGKSPSKNQIKALEYEHNLSYRKIYKWFHTQKQIREEFGPVVLFNHSKDASGHILTPSEVRHSIVMNERTNDHHLAEELAAKLGLDLDNLVVHVLEQLSPKNTRKVIRMSKPADTFSETLKGEISDSQDVISRLPVTTIRTHSSQAPNQTP